MRLLVTPSGFSTLILVASGETEPAPIPESVVLNEFDSALRDCRSQQLGRRTREPPRVVPESS